MITGADAAARVLPRLAVELVALRPWRDEIAVVAEQLVEQHPFQPLLMSMPGVGTGPRPGSSPKPPRIPLQSPVTSPPESTLRREPQMRNPDRRRARLLA